MSNLKTLAQAALKSNPKAEKIFATSDGNVFVNKNHANLHANTNRTGKKLIVSTFTANELKGKSSAEKAAEAKATKEAANKAKAEKVAEAKATKEAADKAKAEEKGTDQN